MTNARDMATCAHVTVTNLMELGEVRRVERLVAEDAIDRKVLLGLEDFAGLPTGESTRIRGEVTRMGGRSRHGGARMGCPILEQPRTFPASFASCARA